MTVFDQITKVKTDPLPDTGIESWDNNGVLIIENIIPPDLIQAYINERTFTLPPEKYNPGWSKPTPYLHIKSMRDIALYEPLQETLAKLLGDPAGLHLCLTGFKSTERAWHQDSYLNPPGVDDHYLAVWFALDDIHADSGPFQYVEGSHKWPVIQRGLVQDRERELTGKLNPDTWPSDSQGWVGQACAEEITERGAIVKSFLPKKGDLLIWHSSLVHRGSVATNKTLMRPALIAHYSSINHRPDMPKAVKSGDGYVFPFNHQLE